MSEDEEKEMYRRSVRSRIQHHNHHLFENRDRENLKIIVSEFCHSAEKSVDVFCQRFDADVYAAPLVWLNEIIYGVKIRLLVVEEGDEVPEGIEYHVCKSYCPPNTNLMLVDGKRYRMEVDESALVCAEVSEENNTKSSARVIKEFFDRCWVASGGTLEVEEEEQPREGFFKRLFKRFLWR